MVEPIAEAVIVPLMSGAAGALGAARAIGAATGIFLSVNWALATDLIPTQEAGKYLGLSNLATAGAGATARLAGPLIDGVNALRPGTYRGYPVVFVLASAATLAGTVLLVRVRQAARAPGS